MGTIASIDQPNQIVTLTDGTAVRVTPSTQMHMGMAGKTMALTDRQPGDELVTRVRDAPLTRAWLSGLDDMAIQPPTILRGL